MGIDKQDESGEDEAEVRGDGGEVDGEGGSTNTTKLCVHSSQLSFISCNCIDLLVARLHLVSLYVESFSKLLLE